MGVPTWFEVTTFGVLGVLLLVDLAVVGRRPHVPKLGEAAGWVAFYVGLALVFVVLLLVVDGPHTAGAFAAGWLTEYSLSVDNLFVFVVIMGRFAVPRAYQQKVLMIGVLLSLVLRGGFIAVGTEVIHRFSAIFYLFGAFLIWTAVQLVRSGVEDEAEFSENAVIRLARRVLPMAPDYDGAKLTTRTASGRLLTPIALVFLAIGTTDLLFALDSIPAIFGLTTDAFLVFTATIFALMGLRQLYFLLGGLLARLSMLSYGLAVILGFIGIKLLLDALRENHLPFVNGGHPVTAVPDVPIWVSLTVIVGVLAVVTLLSLVTGKRSR